MVPLGTVAAGLAMSVIGPRLTMGIMAAAVVGLGVIWSPYVLKVLSVLEKGPVFQKPEALEGLAEGGRAADGRSSAEAAG
jgi:hypothetical protein